MKPYFVKIVRGKLSLCSRDIEVGDQVYYNDKRAPTHIWTERNEEFDKYLQPYKIIGEISPDAKWVKEGDEFNDYEVFPMHTHDENTGAVIYTNDDEEVVDIPIYKIKCPTCGNFH